LKSAVAAYHDSDVVAVGEGDVHFRNSSFADGSKHFRRERLVGFEQYFAGLSVDKFADGNGAFKIGWSNLHLRYARLAKLLEKRLGNAFVRAHKSFARLGMLDFFRQLAIDQAFGKVPEKFAIAQRNAFHLVEGAQNVFIRFHSQRAKEDRAQEFALAVDAHVQNIFRVVLELNPGSAVRNNLPEEVAAVVRALEENTRRAVQLADDDAFGAVDDERAVLRHQRDVAVENFLFLDVANGLRAGIGILVVNG
jgi:hypothetical protein